MKPSGFWHRCRDFIGQAFAVVWGLTLIFVFASAVAFAIVYPVFLWERYA